MARTTEYSQVTDWNALGLRGYSQQRTHVFSGEHSRFTTVMLARDARGWTEPVQPELTDEELLEAAEHEGHFEFLEDPAEDIYTWDDGEEI